MKLQLVEAVELAGGMEGPDIFVAEGLRTKERQAELVKAKLSRTMNSRHLTGGAVDLCVMVGKDQRWDWPAFYPLAERMRAAARRAGCSLTWGAIWDRRLELLGGDLEDQARRYVERMRRKGIKAFADGPHFQLEEAAT